ncbi:MAG: 50S ribosomal protein L23 [Candidatus Pacebacteria bacterium]|nr:50S ribosomal protein L23 [Candidatus Paceibacterota bacterium]NUQ57169.1 50S ribosomal protein L23 [Candidatus Paceibacter sp.]
MAFLKKAKSKTAEEKKDVSEVKEIKEEKSSKKKGEEKTSAAPKALKPHITEKAAFLGEKGAYVFKVAPGFNKIMVKEAVKKQYGVNPVKVSMVNAPGKMFLIRRRRVQSAGFKKAVVYLKKGEKINIA